ncbi:MAG: TonB family protein [Candidatus Gastranaerophilales bacterium]|nr:TonB family protein [Candidatus Gastranaerophilales bacterium]
MLGQDLDIQKRIKTKSIEKIAILKEDAEKIPITEALKVSSSAHITLFLLLLFLPFLLQFFGIDFLTFKRPEARTRDIEFVLVNQPEKEPINKNTHLRADRNTQAGGQHDPKKRIAPPSNPLPKNNPAPAQKSQASSKIAPTQTAKPRAEQVRKIQEPPKMAAKEPDKPIPPKPSAKPLSIPFTKAPTSFKIPSAPMKSAPKIATNVGGPVTTAPGASSSSSGGSPKPVLASGGYGSSSSRSSSAGGSGTSGGSVYSPGGGSAGNPGPGNPKGAPGVDAIKEPNFGPYMAELQRRIKSNWNPPRGDESKRVVLLFKIAKDGRLLNVKVAKSSGLPNADKAALAAVELTAPFRPLPADYKGSDIDIQFTFDYNVFGVSSRY